MARPDRGANVPNTPYRLNLPEPRQSGVAVERCISQRRSVRDFRARALTAGQLGQLLWAAQGVTGEEEERTVPSAGALYPLELYAVVGSAVDLAPGVFRYHPGRHELLLVEPGDLRQKLVVATGGQDWIAMVPAIVCIAAVFHRTTVKYGSRGHSYVYLEAGHAAESLMLQAVALGLATTMVGAFSDDDVKHILHLGRDETPLCLIPVGSP